MKLRKILASTVAIVACFAMLSTTAFAASELTLTTGKDGDKIKTTIAGAVEGQVTFLAVNAGTALSDTTAPADMQYIDQQTKEAASDVAVSFSKRTGGTDTVDIYAGGSSVTEVAVKYGVAVAEAAAVTGETNFELPSNEIPADEAEWATWLQGKVSVAYTELGSTEAKTVACTATNGADFTATAEAGEGIYTVAVAYKGLAAGTVTATLVAPPSPVTGITVAGATNIELFVDDELTEDMAVEAAKEVAITVTSTHEDTSTKTVTGGYTYVWEEATETVAIEYKGFTAAEKFTFTATRRAYAGVVTSEGTFRTDLEGLGITSIDDATEALVEPVVKAMIASTGFAPEYTWNDTEKANTAIPADNFAYTTTAGAATSELKIFVVNVATKDAAGSVPAGTALGTITVEVSAASKTIIKGVVTVADTTGDLIGFGATAPVGAVVTAIQLTDDLNGGNFVADGYKSFAAVTGIGGTFELEVEEGAYKVLVAHAKFEFVEGELYISRTVKYEEDVTIADGEEIDLGTVNLKYAFFGDTDLDGDVDPDDYATFAARFGTSVQ